jgi:rSAM/selenodomain-associated transferase 1
LSLLRSRGWLIVFAKAPRPGLVKTRLSPPFSLDECAEFYREMLSDVLAASAAFAAELALEPVLAFHPPEAANELIGLAPPGYRLHPQRGAGLGERMAHAASEAAAAGAERILIRGSDSPALPRSVLEEAIARLDRGVDVVLSPDQGGGYALVGMRRPDRRLFELPMSTRGVLEQTLSRAKSLGLRADTISGAFDLDIVGDLQLMNDLPEGAGVQLCPRTLEFLSTMPRLPVL